LLDTRLRPRRFDDVVDKLAPDAAPAVFRRDVHSEYRSLVPVLRPRFARKPHDPGELVADERAEDPIRAVRGEAALGRGQRFVAVFRVARRKGIGMLLQSPQPERAIRARILGGQAADRDVR